MRIALFAAFTGATAAAVLAQVFTCLHCGVSARYARDARAGNFGQIRAGLAHNRVIYSPEPKFPGADMDWVQRLRDESPLFVNRIRLWLGWRCHSVPPVFP